MTALRASFLMVGLLWVAGCKKDAPAGAPPAVPEAAKPAAVVAPADETLTGAVAERLDAPNYTYLRISTPQGDSWAAVPTTPVAVGTKVRITKPMLMQNFESKTLGRTFEKVFFGGAAEVLDGALAAAPPAAAPAPAADPHSGQLPLPPAATAVDLSNIKVAKPAGPDGRTIAELYAQRATLKDKTASVRGKVVKVTGGVLGRNWLHLRDGSGTDAAQDNDLIVTTAATVQLNDEVTAQGMVRTDKDLGSGYSYKVLVEDAKVSP